MAEEEKELERIYVVPLRNVKRGKSSKAAPRAVKTVRDYLVRHMKVTEDKVWIDDSLNHELWSHGKYSVPSKIRVRAVKFEDGVVEASLPELGLKTSRRELLKEEKKKKLPILRRRGEEEEVPEEGVVGAEDYEIAPTGDGEVKIKKKKAPKKKEEEKEEPAEKKPKKKEKAKKKAAKKEKKKEEKPKKAAKKKTTKKATTKKKKAPAKKK